jgi:hypothetical protein
VSAAFSGILTTFDWSGTESGTTGIGEGGGTAAEGRTFDIGGVTPTGTVTKIGSGDLLAPVVRRNKVTNSATVTPERISQSELDFIAVPVG